MRQAALEMSDVIRQRIGPVQQYTLAGIILAELAGIWIAFAHRGTKGLTPAAFATLVPIATALLMVAMLLPRLSSLKVASVEAQLVMPPRDAQPQALVGPAADVDMTPALEPLILGRLLCVRSVELSPQRELAHTFFHPSAADLQARYAPCTF